MGYRLMLADDHQMFREALRILLEKQTGYEVVAETGDGLKVMSLVHEMKPDIVCMDIDMPGLNGIELTRQITMTLPSARVVALSTYCDRRYVANMMSAGALAYVTKTEAGSELVRAIESVSRNRSYLCADATDALRESMSGQSDQSPAPEPKLGAREVEVLKLVAVGLTSAQIAEKLAIASSTVEVHRRNIMRKLSVDNAVGLTRYAIRNGLIANQ